MLQACHLSKSMFSVKTNFYQQTGEQKCTAGRSSQPFIQAATRQHSKLHPALPCPSHLQTSRKRAASRTWNGREWLQFPSLEGSKRRSVEKQIETSKEGTLPREVLPPSAELLNPLKGTIPSPTGNPQHFRAIHVLW